MNYGVSDSSGTDDDLPPSHQNRFTRGGRFAGNGRSMVGGPPPHPRIQSDMETQIHLIEQEAYCAVLRAFKAQSDAITWEKEELITELRKELRVSDEEHRELLSRVNADEVIRRIREWRKTNGLQPGILSAPQPIHDNIPSPTVSASRKKQKTSQSVASLSGGAPPPPMPQSMQPSSSAGKQVPVLGARGKKTKSYPSSNLSGRAQHLNHDNLGGFSANELPKPPNTDPLIGRKVWIRWPDDNNFYEAVITDCDPTKGLHALVYDMNTANEAWEWVNLKEMAPEDIRWEGESAGAPHRGGNGGPGHGMKKLGPRSAGPGPGRGAGIPKNKKESSFSQNGIGRKLSGNIDLLHTESLVKEVESLFSSNHPDPMDVEKARKILKEHEQALVKAIARLAEAANDGSDGEGRRIQGLEGEKIAR